MVIAVGPVLDDVLAGVEGVDATVLYASTVRPFDSAALRAALADRGSGSADVVVVEPYLAGTSTPFVAEALADRPHRVLGLGVSRQELRHYGTMQEHIAAHGLDARSLRERISAWASPQGLSARPW